MDTKFDDGDGLIHIYKHKKTTPKSKSMKVKCREREGCGRDVREGREAHVMQPHVGSKLYPLRVTRSKKNTFVINDQREL